ncbi:class I SAM-dependent rRNA methyltransferase [Thermocrinis sp.]
MIEVRVKDRVGEKIKGFFPWIYNLEILEIKGKPKPGDFVKVLDSKKKVLGYGYINPNTKIAVRLLSFDEKEEISKELVKQRLLSALEYRKRLNINSNAFRLIHSEGDFLPGLIVDVFDQYVVMEITTYGMVKMKNWVLESLVELLKPKGIYQKVSDYAMNIEGFEEEEKILYGTVPEVIKIWEGDLEFYVDVVKGQKTGFYLDQRKARKMIRDLVKPGDVCLDLFCHTGGFALNMIKKGAKKVIAVDMSERALNLGKENAKLNGLEGIEWVEENAFHFLRKLAKEGSEFDVIVIDPPSFARTKAHVENALRGYKELCVRALKIVKPGGYIAIYSCSFHITREHLFEVILQASRDVKRAVRIVGESFQDLDHPWILQMPNTLYLKGVYLEVFR